MVLLMYWENDNEEKRKANREERLRAKKLGLPEPQMISAEITNDSSKEILDILSKQTAISLDQSKKIDQLSQIILEQQKIIDKISDQKTEVITREIIREVPATGETPTEKKEKEVKEKKFKKLDDIDVNIIDTSGIEAVGEVTAQVTKGNSIKSQLDKLRQLKKKENNNE
jgi:hypothetical protein